MICSNCGRKTDGGDLCPDCKPAEPPHWSPLTYLLKLDEILAGACLTIMILMVLTQIVLRNTLNTGIAGADALVRHLVLWVVFLGAGIAAKNNSHIKIDVMSRVLPPGLKRYTDMLVNLFSVSVICVLIYAAYTFVSIEYQSGIAIPLLDIPSLELSLRVPVWILETIIPAGYIIIAVRFVINGINAMFRNQENP